MLSGKVCLITGSSSGIGRATAQLFAQHGASVAVVSRCLERGWAVARELNREGDQTHCAIKLDVRGDPTTIDTAIAEAQSQSGPIDVLVNCAGLNSDNLLNRTSDSDIEDIIQTNLLGTIRVTRGVSRGFIRRRQGCVVNISSVVARMGSPGQSIYAATKAGVEGFTRSLARELGPRGIRVNCVRPGFVPTGMTAGLSAARTEQITTHTSLRRLGQAAEVANCVLFLASDMSSFVTGQTLCVDGGLQM